MSQQVSDPLGVLDIGLATRYRFDVLRVGQEDFELTLQQVERRLPIHAGTLHGDVGHAFGRQPVGQRQQIVGHRPERSDLLMRRSLRP